MTRSISRRRFLSSSALYGGALWLSVHLPRPRTAAAATESSDPATLTAVEWKTLEAICDRIVPKDDDPGAVEAGCVNFIDKALANEDAAQLPIYRAGIPALAALSQARHGVAFEELDAAKRDALLASLQQGKAPEWKESSVTPADFFETVRLHTVIGLLADPRYGGNHDYAGWKLVGYPGPRHHMGGYTPEQMAGTAPIKAIWGEDV